MYIQIHVYIYIHSHTYIHIYTHPLTSVLASNLPARDVFGVSKNHPLGLSNGRTEVHIEVHPPPTQGMSFAEGCGHQLGEEQEFFEGEGWAEGHLGSNWGVHWCVCVCGYYRRRIFGVYMTSIDRSI